MSVSLSHEVIPLYREYERFSTTCLNAYVGPKTARYLENFDGALRGLGMDAGLHLMQSSGGCATLDAAKRRVVTCSPTVERFFGSPAIGPGFAPICFSACEGCKGHGDQL